MNKSHVSLFKYREPLNKTAFKIILFINPVHNKAKFSKDIYMTLKCDITHAEIFHLNSNVYQNKINKKICLSQRCLSL